MSSANNKLNMVIAGDQIDSHACIQNAAPSANCRHSSVYSHMQLMDYLLKKGSYKNCPEPNPDCVLLHFENPSHDVAGIVQHIRYFHEFDNVEIFVLGKHISDGEKEKFISLGATAVYELAQGYMPLAECIVPKVTEMKYKPVSADNPGAAA